MMRSPKAAVLAALAMLLLCPPFPARADEPKRAGENEGGGTLPQNIVGLHISHANGQTFVSWDPAGGGGWRYYVYRLNRPIRTESDLQAATMIAMLGDSTACDRRLSAITGTIYSYVVDAQTELSPASGLLVYTPTVSGLAYYAVTSQGVALPENRRLSVNENTLENPIEELLGDPTLIYQRDVSFGGRVISVYSLFTTPVDTPRFPAMSNRPGAVFDCGIVHTPGVQPGLLLLKPHQRLGDFMNASAGTKTPGEYVLALDDPLPNGENSFWFGYHPSYNSATINNPTPTSGVVVDYTFRRVKFTIDWALRTFPIDPGRVYAFGYSMGGIGSLEFALWMPERIAAVMSSMGKFDFSFLDEPVWSWFNPGHPMRATVDQMWGQVATDLKLPDGLGVFERMNLGWIVSQADARGVPPVIALNGKRDNVVGWAEKLPFYTAMQQHRHGGAFFWDNSDHYAQAMRRYWQPMVDPAYLYRFRSDRSYPAFTNCSLDDDPGTGVFASGDTIGTINGFMEWDTTLVDLPDMWQATLRMRSLYADGNITLPAPDSCLADVTPNRVQRLTFTPGTSVPFSVRRMPDYAVIQSGLAPVDALGRPTALQVRIKKTGVLITFGRQPSFLLDAGTPPPASRMRLALSANPVRGVLRLSTAWTAGTAGRVDLLDIAGRIVKPIYAGPRPPAGELAVDTGRLAPGLYLVHASAGTEHVTERVVVIH